MSDIEWANLPSHFDSPIKQRCLEDLRAYHDYLQERLDDLPKGDSRRLSIMVEMNGTLGAIKSLTKADDEEVQKAHDWLLQQTADKDFHPPSQQ